MVASIRGGNFQGVKIGQTGGSPPYFLLDTFTGAAGQLSAHTGEVGAIWTDGGNDGVSGVAFTDLLLNGSGSTYLNFIGSSLEGQQAANASGNPAADLSNFYIEVDATVDTSQITQWGGVVIFSGDGYANSFGINISFEIYATDPHPPNVYTLQAIFFGSTVTESVGGTPYTVASGSHTFRVNVTNNRKTFEFLIDNVSMFTGSNLGSMPTITATGFWTDSIISPDTNPQAVRINRIAGAPL
jgi:hypothetical protein